MTLEEAKRDILYGGHTYDELTEVQRDFIDYFWEEMIRRMGEIMCARPYKTKHPIDWNYQGIDSTRVQAPPRNYREEHEQFIAHLIYIQSEKDKCIDVTSMYPRLRKAK